MKDLPEPGTTVLIHVPHDGRTVLVRISGTDVAGHYIEGLPVRSEVKHWCGVPLPPDRDWAPAEEIVATRLTSETILPLANVEPVAA
jgi:hypothetical protein